MIFTQPVLYELPLLAAETLLIIGQRDRTALGATWAPECVAEALGNYPALGRKAAAAIPRAHLVEIADAGHPSPRSKRSASTSKRLLRSYSKVSSRRRCGR